MCFDSQKVYISLTWKSMKASTSPLDTFSLVLGCKGKRGFWVTQNSLNFTTHLLKHMGIGFVWGIVYKETCEFSVAETFSACSMCKKNNQWGYGSRRQIFKWTTEKNHFIQSFKKCEDLRRRCLVRFMHYLIPTLILNIVFQIDDAANKVQFDI